MNKKKRARQKIARISLIICLNSMYAVVLLFFYCWRFIVLKNRLQCYSTKVLNGYQQQANLFVSITVCTDLPDMLLPMRLRNRNIQMIYHFQRNFSKENRYFSLRIKKTSVVTAWEFVQNKFILRVSQFGRISRGVHL